MYDEITINEELDRDNLDWLLHISTRTGISVSGDSTITDDFARLVISTIKNQDKEILRLNNIINKLEKWLNDEIYRHEEVYKPSNPIFIENGELHKVLDKLIELKEK